MRRRTDPAAPTPAGTSLAERKRQVVRDELGEAALQLLARQGFEETTVDQIVAAAGVSRRTFFRYFASKEDVVIESLGDFASAVVAEVAARPPEESAAQAAREAIKAVTSWKFTEYPEKSLALVRYTLGIPALRARYVARQDVFRSELAAALDARRPGADTAVRTELTAGIALLALTEALGRWSADDGARDFAELIDETFSEAAIAFVV